MCGVFIRVRDLSAGNKCLLHVRVIPLSSLRLHITVPVKHTHTVYTSVLYHQWQWCTFAWTTGEDLLHCGSLPLCGSALVVDKVDSSQVVLTLFPARGQRGQQLTLPGPRHVLSLQKLPTGLHNMFWKNSVRRGIDWLEIISILNPAVSLHALKMPWQLGGKFTGSDED